MSNWETLLLQVCEEERELTFDFRRCTRQAGPECEQQQTQVNHIASVFISASGAITCRTAATWTVDQSLGTFTVSKPGL